MELAAREMMYEFYERFVQEVVKQGQKLEKEVNKQ